MTPQTPQGALSDADIEDCIDSSNRKFNSYRSQIRGQQLTTHDDWKHWLAREVEAAVRAQAPSAADAARFRYLCANPNWAFMEDLCRSFVGESESAFYAELSAAIDARMNKPHPFGVPL